MLLFNQFQLNNNDKFWQCRCSIWWLKEKKDVNNSLVLYWTDKNYIQWQFIGIDYLFWIISLLTWLLRNNLRLMLLYIALIASEIKSLLYLHLTHCSFFINRFCFVSKMFKSFMLAGLCVEIYRKSFLTGNHLSKSFLVQNSWCI